MNSILNFTLITVLCCFINASFALSSTKTIPTSLPPKSITSSVTFPSTTTITSTVTKATATLDITYYTTTIIGKDSSVYTVLPNNVKVDPNSLHCKISQGYGEIVMIEHCNPETQGRTTTSSCYLTHSTHQVVKRSCTVNSETLSTTIPVTKTACQDIIAHCGYQTRMTSYYKTLPTSGKTLPVLTALTKDPLVTTIIENNIQTLIKPVYSYYTCKQETYTEDCYLKVTTTESLPPKTTTTTNSLSSTTTTSFSFPPKTTITTNSLSSTTTTSFSFPPKTTTTTTNSLSSTTTTSFSFPPKATTTTNSLSSTTTTSFSFPPKTVTTTNSVSQKTTTTNTIPPKTGTKCIPVTITVTEKVKTTTTIKETVTVTVNGGPSNVNESQCADKYAQCGGIGYNGPSCCKSGFTCHEYSPYYSQCV